MPVSVPHTSKITNNLHWHKTVATYGIASYMIYGMPYTHTQVYIGYTYMGHCNWLHYNLVPERLNLTYNDAIYIYVTAGGHFPDCQGAEDRMGEIPTVSKRSLCKMAARNIVTSSESSPKEAELSTEVSVCNL